MFQMLDDNSTWDMAQEERNIIVALDEIVGRKTRQENLLHLHLHPDPERNWKQQKIVINLFLISPEKIFFLLMSSSNRVVRCNFSSSPSSSTFYGEISISFVSSISQNATWFRHETTIVMLCGLRKWTIEDDSILRDFNWLTMLMVLKKLRWWKLIRKFETHRCCCMLRICISWLCC